MSSAGHKKSEDGLVGRYQSNLERRIEKAVRGLVCRDEELCKEVEALLTKGNAQKILNQRGLDSLSVMESSVRALPAKTGQMGLEKLSKAFEVLELAALNLYLYPWRKEYRVVKMFSGMFTHLIKPALTEQQAKELFGLMGYQPAGPCEEELTLNSKLVPANILLSLACAFFTARTECQLLLSALGAQDRNAEWVLQLVKERKSGNSLQVALENTKRKLESARALDPCLTPGINAEVDLYTDNSDPVIKEEADAIHMTPSTCLPSHASNMQIGLINNHSYNDTSQPDRVSNGDPSQGKALCSSTLHLQVNNPKKHVSYTQIPGPLTTFGKEEQTEGESQTRKADSERVVCSCITSSSWYLHLCDQCNDIHSSFCPHYAECKIRRHTFTLCPDEVVEQLQLQFNSIQNQHGPGKEKAKDSLKKHDCMSNLSYDYFLVCYNCQFIHDRTCKTIQTCTLLNHNLQPTGRLQPPQEKGANSQKRHDCLSAEASEYVICHTCNNSHDLTCKEFLNCRKDDHKVQYLLELDNTETPLQCHQCCSPTQPWPEIACLTCKVCHISDCLDVRQCTQNHKIQQLGTKCVSCSASVLQVWCSYCGALYCKECWYKNPLSCKCGKTFGLASPV